MPVQTSDTWRQLQRHWHCYADETGLNEPLDYNRPEHTVAATPDEVLAWLAAETDRLLPRVSARWQAEADRLTTDEALRAVHRATLQRGKGTGATIRLADVRVVMLLAIPAGPEIDDPGILSAQVCARHGS